mmetsp:Transcript_1766/g.3929  ORF Transcript_1766/g.3929 Transcript_1766/m.3929 type:complete len:797 (+) Transcript_1766:78-2468(+)
MDDSECVCPLCCEEMDISDQQFYPCKCGYQVCMWCWHRIKEQESGLCPACRTPYGDDPHEFSAVDVEEVLKAKKEKEALERERKRNNHHDGNSLDGEGLPLAGMKGQMDVPRDRSQLANMRVIRRNLVYAVGLPIGMATEEILRKPDYFGQYGKISKIVLNRSQATAADPRRASASAYVTFAYKEDTLACILAVDGFYIEGRSVRASYGTSKYCSAFIKNVRCNNPECTYLHTMGDAEDTFTKQEIQAGYVTSGRDVLARQQEIVQQALSASGGASSRRKIGGGGPSATGKAASSPVFPPPSFDEPIKPAASTLVPPPQVAPGRSLSSGAAFPTIAAANAQVNAAAAASPAPVPGPGKVSRSSSIGSVGSAGSLTGLAAAAPKGSIGGPIKSKGSIAAPPVPPRKGAIPAPTASAVSAASVVAGVHSVSTSSEPPAPHTTLTPLTPLKRSTGTSKASETTKLTSLRAAGTRKPAAVRGVSTSAAAPNPISPARAPISNRARSEGGVGGIGGTVIAAPTPVGNPIISRGPAPPVNPSTGRLSELGGDALGGLGGEVFNGPLKSAPIGAPGQGGMDKWNSVGLGGDPVVPANSGGLFGGTPQPMSGSSNFGQIGGIAIGGGNHPSGSGSSALASMLGINLPTGSGSLHESSSQWMGSAPGSQAPISALNGTSVPVGGGVIGGPGISNGAGNGSIGGVTIGGPSPMPTGGPIGGNGNKSDIALLQSLLPGVHITSGGSYNTQDNGFGSVGHNPNAPQGQYWEGNLQSNLGGQPIGTIGGGTIGSGVVNQNQRQAPGSIW